MDQFITPAMIFGDMKTSPHIIINKKDKSAHHKSTTKTMKMPNDMTTEYSPVLVFSLSQIWATRLANKPVSLNKGYFLSWLPFHIFLDNQPLLVKSTVVFQFSLTSSKIY